MITQMLPDVSVVIPTINSSQHIGYTINSVLQHFEDSSNLEMIVVDDGSLDGTFAVLNDVLSSSIIGRYTVIEMAQSVGQSAATSIGLAYASGKVVVTIDDDLPFAPTQIDTLIDGLRDDLDFVVGEPTRARNGRLRELASRWAGRLAASQLELPSNFRLTSFVAYRGDFLRRIAIENRRVDEFGWMFWYTRRFENVAVVNQRGIRKGSNYGLRSLFKAAKPFLVFMVSRVARLVLILSLLTAIVALLLAGTYLLVSIFVDDLLPGFPTLAILIAVNLALTAGVLSVAVSLRERLNNLRRTDVFLLQRHVVSGGTTSDHVPR